MAYVGYYKSKNRILWRSPLSPPIVPRIRLRRQPSPKLRHYETLLKVFVEDFDWKKENLYGFCKRENAEAIANAIPLNCEVSEDFYQGTFYIVIRLN